MIGKIQFLKCGFLHSYNNINLKSIFRSFHKQSKGSNGNDRGRIIRKRIAESENSKQNKSENDAKNNSEQPSSGSNKSFTFLALSISLAGVGILRSVSDTRRLSLLPVVTIEELEHEYLLKGEIRQIYVPSFLSSIISRVSHEAVLYYDGTRDFQSVAVSSDSAGIGRMIRSKEQELKVNPKEAILFRSDLMTDLLIAQVFLALGFRNRKKDNFTIDIQIHKFPKRNGKPESPFRFGIPPASASNNTKSRNDPNPMDIFSQMFTGNVVNEFTQKTDIKFKDVAGLHAAKQEVIEFLEYLNNPAKFIRLGARLPRGAMLLGPPGCGKTLLIKALANESNVPFYYNAASDFVHMIGGVGAQRMRKLFQDARENSPAIIFLDEIDAIGKTRSQSSDSGGDSDQTLNQLLVEMDGMDPNSGIVVFAATNRAELLDKALTRPGRLDRHIFIDLPVLAERKELFQLYLGKLESHLESAAIELKNRLAQQTPGMSGADIANLCNEAALTAARFDYKIITNECFDIALERIIAGAAKRSKVLTENERRVVAYHEAGHALVGWMLKYADPVLKVSIVPRTNAALGFAQLSMTERYLMHYDILFDKVTVLVAGRVAESLKFNSLTSGAHDDLRKVKKLVYSMIREWGMSQKVGHLSFRVTDEDEQMGILPFSKATQGLIESEANQIISLAFKRAESLIKQYREQLDLLANELLTKEVIMNSDIKLLIGPRPHESNVSD